MDVSKLIQSRPELAANPLTGRLLAVLQKRLGSEIGRADVLTAALSKIHSDEEAKIRFLFEVYDEDGDGFVSSEDLRRVIRVMADSLAEKQLRELVGRTIRDHDVDGDGVLDFGEFKTAIRNIHIGSQLDWS